MGKQNEKINVIFPGDFIDPKYPDSDWSSESSTAAKNTFFNVLFLDQKKWCLDSKLTLHGLVQGNIFLYRGWMMKPEEYDIFYRKIQNMGGELLTSPEQYRALHLFSESYPLVQRDSPKTLFFPLTESGEIPHLSIKTLSYELGDFIIKDYVKSVKGGQFPEFFTPKDSQAYFEQAMKLFQKYKLNNLVGGICAKSKVTLKKYKGNSNEIRVFYLFNRPISIQYELDLKEINPTTLPLELVEKYSNLPSPFYTVDFAETDTGSFIVLETGDGQVSGLREFEDIFKFYQLLKENFIHEC